MLSENLVESLSDAIKKQLNSNSEEKVKKFLFDNFLDPMIQHSIHVSICIDNKSGTSLNMSLIHKLLALIGKTVSKLNLKYGQKLFDKLIEFSTLGAVDQLLPSVPPTCFCTYQMGPQFLVTLNDSQALIVFILISELISNLKYEIRAKQSIELFDKLFEFSINHKNQEICRLASKSTGVLVNRFDSNNDVLNEKLRQILSFFTEKLFDSEVSDEKETLIIDVLVWITKGLVIRKHSQRNGFIDLLISLCEHQNHVIRTQVSKGFEAIHRSDESCLTEENNAIVTLLYNQRFYFETFEPLLRGYLKHKNQNSDKKQTFLTALLTQLNYITKPVFRTQLKSLVPMLLDAIDGEGVEGNQRAALEAISQIMIDKNHQILNPSLKSFANNCINLSINSPFLRVRRSALNCLALIADTFDDSDISYLRETMVRDLRKALNDKKRVVRKSAVTARCKWILVGQPGK